MSVSEAISKFSSKAERMTDKATDKTKNLVDEGGNNLSDTLDSVRDNAGPLLSKASRRAQSMANDLRDSVTDIADGAVAYTKKNPMTAVLIAAASGALVFGLVKALCLLPRLSIAFEAACDPRIAERVRSAILGSPQSVRPNVE